MFGKNGDSLLEFKYSEKVFSLELSEFIDIEDIGFNFEFPLSPITIGDIPPLEEKISLQSVLDGDGTSSALVAGYDNKCDNPFPEMNDIKVPDIPIQLSDDQFTSATFSEGKLSVQIKNGWPTTLKDIELVLKNASDNLIIGTLEYAEIQSKDSLLDYIDLAGKTVNSNIVGEFVSASTPGTAPDNTCIKFSDEIIVNVSGTNLVVVSALAKFPKQEVINDTMDFALELDSGEELSTLKLESGSLDLEIEYGIEESATIYIELPYAKLGSNSFKDSVSIGPGPTTLIKSFDLSEYSFDLTKGGKSVNAIMAIVKGSIDASDDDVNFKTSNSVKADIKMVNIKPSFIDGYFGKQSLSLAPESFDFDLGDVSVFEKISFADPTVTIGFHNTFGIPMSIENLDLEMKRGDKSGSLNASSLIPFDILPGNILTPDVPVTSELILGSETNIGELISIWPNSVTAGFSSEINSDTLNDGKYNFALDTSKMDVTLDLSIPLYGTVGEFIISDTIDIDLSILEAFEYVKKATLRTHINNGFPLEAAVKFYITDENYLILDSLESADKSDIIINAATVDPNNGKVIANGVKQSDLIVDESDINLLSTVGYKIILKAKLSTANSGNPVKIYSFYEIDLKVGVKAKILFEEEFNLSNN
jgi:hypothetical protein